VGRASAWSNDKREARIVLDLRPARETFCDPGTK
jgi:hypothetical protein